MHAEDAYLFRHALLRDAAYQMQMPGDRAKLHELACYSIEEVFGGRAPEAPPLDAVDQPNMEPHPTDAVAADLAEHASRAIEFDSGTQPSGSLSALARTYTRRAAEHLEQKFQAEAAAEAWRRLAEWVSGVHRGEALRRAGVVLCKSGRTQAAEALLRQALVVHGAEGHRRFEGIAQGDLANLFHQTGRLEEAERAHERALKIHTAVGNNRSAGVALGNLAIIYQRTGRFEQAEQTYKNALAVQRQVGDKRTEGVALGNLGTLYERTARISEAETAFEQALALHHEIGNKRFEGVVLGNLAVVYEQTGRTEQAEHAFEQALTIHRQVGHSRFEGLVLCDLATFKIATARHEVVARLWQDGAAILREVGDVIGLKQAEETMREACAKAGIEPFDVPVEDDTALNVSDD